MITGEKRILDAIPGKSYYHKIDSVPLETKPSERFFRAYDLLRPVLKMLRLQVKPFLVLQCQLAAIVKTLRFFYSMVSACRLLIHHHSSPRELSSLLESVYFCPIIVLLKSKRSSL